MAKKKGKKTVKSPPPVRRDHRDVRGLILLVFSVGMFLSLISFSLHATASYNWLGVIGHAWGWASTAAFGLSSYLICIFLAWVGGCLLIKKTVPDLVFSSLCIALCVFSLSILLSMIEKDFLPLSIWLSKTLYSSAWEHKMRYHLGGAPSYYLYSDLPSYNLRYILNIPGVMILFSASLISSLLLLFKISPFAFLNRLPELLQRLRWERTPKPPEPIKEEEPVFAVQKTAKPVSKEDLKAPEQLPDSDFMRYVKLRIPTSLSSGAAAPATSPSPLSQGEMLAIHPEKNLKLRPSLSRKGEGELLEKPAVDKGVEAKSIEPAKVVEKSVAKEPTAKQRRDAAIAAQKVHNGDFSGYQLPSASLLTTAKKLDHSSLKKDLRHKAEVLEETLLSFGIEAKVGQINCGPTITSFEVHPAIGVKVQKIKTLENDIALNMEAKSIRIIAPIPGKAAVGIEVPNAQAEEVGFKEMLQAYQQGGKKLHIPILLGKSVQGDYVMTDLTKMPHCIIAGATGSGKSVCINTIVMAILLNAKPDEIKLIMVDPKKVELTPYTRLPHMLAPVITEPQGACAAMNWLVKEMEKRYELLKQVGVRNIDAFNNRTIDEAFESSLNIEIPPKLPYIVGIIDELADLMMVSSSDIETPIARIAQMARAVGIHLILATQRPSREVITGLIKANFPTRIAFKVSSRVNSQIILDDVGAESLLGNGDMLFLPPGSSHLVRAQGAFIRDEDINGVVKMICEQAPPRYVIESFDRMGSIDLTDAVDGDDEPGDALYGQALDVVIGTGNASTTFLQRKLKIGYARAASLIDMLEQKGVVGPAEGSKPRKLLVARSAGDKDEMENSLEGQEGEQNDQLGTIA